MRKNFEIVLTNDKIYYTKWLILIAIGFICGICAIQISAEKEIQLLLITVSCITILFGSTTKKKAYRNWKIGKLGKIFIVLLPTFFYTDPSFFLGSLFSPSQPRSSSPTMEQDQEPLSPWFQMPLYLNLL